MIKFSNIKLAVIGLGYVGLPLAAEFGKYRRTIGFDINQERINELKQGKDRTLEVSRGDLKESKFLSFTNKLQDISESNFFIVTVPTPINSINRPNLRPLLKASKSIGRILKTGDIVVFESTVYPGATEEDCIPVLEQESGLKLNKDFFVGYSPERINPGDRKHKLTQIVKITSGSNEKATKLIDKLYKQIIKAGTHIASSIKVAEAAKVIENTQRDLNIALVNELAMIFNKMEIETEEVLQAASTKWNFLPFQPGLVGGHCIGVDPYYLTHKAEQLGYNPEIILSGRRLNNSMGSYVGKNLLKAIYSKINKTTKKRPKILIMGFAFKENCPDSRNNRSIDIVRFLQKRNCIVDVYDPWVSHEEALNNFNVNLLKEPSKGTYNGIIIAVAHKVFINLGVKKIRSFGKKEHILYDLKHIFSIGDSDLRL